MSVWKRALAVLVTTLPALVSSSGAIEATQSELRRTHDWLSTHLVAGTSHDAPFSFTYDGRPSADLLERWRVERRSRHIEPSKTEHVTTYSDPITRLVVTCRAVEYDHFPTVEWTIDLANAGDRDTPILEHVQPLDLGVRSGGPAAEVLLHHNVGSPTTPEGLRPADDLAHAGQGRTDRGRRGTSPEHRHALLQPGVGRTGHDRGAGMARPVGRPIRPRCRRRAAPRGGGPGTNAFPAPPRREVRSPLVVVQFYEGDWLRGQNLWRRWMVAHNMPRPGGKLVPRTTPPAAATCSPRGRRRSRSSRGICARGSSSTTGSSTPAGIRARVVGEHGHVGGRPSSGSRTASARCPTVPTLTG